MKLDPDSRSALDYRPEIQFSHPDVSPGDAIQRDVQEQTFSLRDEFTKARKLAANISVLGEIAQSRVDELSKGFKVRLDTKVDAATIASMKRKYPENDPGEITYEQYKECKRAQLDRSLELSKESLVSSDDIGEMAEKIKKDGALAGMGGPDDFDSIESKEGGLRPELAKKNQLVEPLDLDEFKNDAIAILANTIWKKFIKDVIPLPPGFGGVLPDKIAKVSSNFDFEDVI